MGVKDHRERAPRRFRFAVVTVSDTASRGEKEDKSGKFLVEELERPGTRGFSTGWCPMKRWR